MKRRLAASLALWSAAMIPPAALAVPAPALAQATALSPATVAAIDGIANEAVRSGQTAGLVVGIAVNGSPVFVRGYGTADLEDSVPVSERTVFRTGSVTKQFTAAAILLLAEDGKLSLDDPLSKYFPDFPRSGEVTLRQMLNHTSGIKNYTSAKDFYPILASRDFTTEQMVANIRALDPLYDFDPGTSWSYSNSGYNLLGAIIEKLSGQSYADFLKARIFEPLGLRDTAIDDAKEIVPHRADGYEVVKDKPGQFTNASYIAMSAAAAAGALRSTAADLLKWQTALHGGKVLKPQSLAAMFEPSRFKNGQLSSTARKPATADEPQFEYGLGILSWSDEGRRAIGHGGNINGFNAHTMTYVEDKVSFVVLANTGGPPASNAGNKIATAFFESRSK